MINTAITAGFTLAALSLIGRFVDLSAGPIGPIGLAALTTTAILVIRHRPRQDRPAR